MLTTSTSKPKGTNLSTPMGLGKNQTQVTLTMTKMQLDLLEKQAAEQALTPLQLIARYIRKGQLNYLLRGEPLDIAV
jgi:hypothetical protein